VARVASEGVNPAELERVKTQWMASTVYQRDSLSSQASELGSNWVLGLPLNAQERTIALLRSVTPAQVQSVAQRYFGDDQLTVATLAPQPLDPNRKPAAAPVDGSRMH
jgi:zinc protease